MNTEKDSIQLSIIDIISNLVYAIDDYWTKYEILWKVSKNLQNLTFCLELLITQSAEIKTYILQFICKLPYFELSLAVQSQCSGVLAES